jgi:uncharacterized protein (UPF0332 family)
MHERNKDNLTWCLENEKRLKRVKPDPQRAQDHIQKAKHNLKAIMHNIAGGFTDWAVAQAYYAMYHALLAILVKNGYESKNHACTIAAAEQLIKEKKTVMTLDDLAVIMTAEQYAPEEAKGLREKFQYGIETEVNEALLERLIKNAKSIVEKAEISLQE